MDNIFVLLLIGFVVGTVGTLIGAGGGFILVPLLIIAQPQLPPETITAISIAIVAANAISGSIAYARSGRIDYKAGILFALFTIPGSVLGVYSTSYIPKMAFHIIFGILLFLLAGFLFFSKKQGGHPSSARFNISGRQTKHELTDRKGNVYSYSYKNLTGIIISLIVGYLSPLLGIGVASYMCQPW